VAPRIRLDWPDQVSKSAGKYYRCALFCTHVWFTVPGGVSKLPTKALKTSPKAFFINLIKWIFKCRSPARDRMLGKLRIFWLLSGLPLAATTLQQLPLAEMAQKSTAIVRTRVKAGAAVLHGSDVYTVYKLDPIEIWKAPVSEMPSEVAVPGGVAGGLRQPVDGAPALVPGREYILFLWTGRSRLTQLMGLSQGLFEVREDMTAWRAPASERMLDRSGRPVRDEVVSMKLGELKAQVARALAGGR
jgi:hypothetical protein